MTAAERPFCSVVIPAYQAAEFIAQAIDSVLAQSYRDFEVIVVNDGSTDDTAGVVRNYNGRVRYIEQDNGGPAVARNTGIAAARGDMLAFLDADDWWAPNRLERCVEELLAQPDIDVVTTDAFLVEGDTPTANRWYGDLGNYEFPPPAQQLSSMIDCNFMFTSTLLPRALVTRVGGFDPAYLGTEDYDLWIRMLRAGARFALIREPLSYYRVRSESLSRNRARQWAQHLSVLERHLPELWPTGVRTSAALYFQIARAATAEHRYRSALTFLAMGARAPGMSAAARVRALGRGFVDVARAPVSSRA
jgi:glycosyltransferase involved in cell wall biosynthesis